MGSLPLPHWFDRISTFGLDTVKQCPAHVPIPCFSYAKPSSFHWPRQPLPTHNSVQVTRHTALNRLPTQPTNFTLSHIQSLSSFFSHAPNSLTRHRSVRCFHNPACFTSERRYKVFAERQTALRLVPRFKTVFAQQRSVQCFPRAAASASLDGSQPSTASCFFLPHPRCRPYPTAQASPIWSAMFSTHKPMLCPTQAISFRYLVSPCRRSDVPQASTPKHFTDLAHSLAPNVACHLPSPAPNHPPVGRALGSLPRLRLKWRASHISSLGWLRTFLFIR